MTGHYVHEVYQYPAEEGTAYVAFQNVNEEEIAVYVEFAWRGDGATEQAARSLVESFLPTDAELTQLFVAPPTPDGSGVGGLRGAVPAVTVGMRYRVSSEAAVYADATSARSLAADAAPGLYNTKVGMEWKPAKSKFGLEGRSLGIQLQSGYRMSLRLRSKGIGVYFRGKF